MSINNWPWSHETQEEMQEHANRYIELLMTNDKIPMEAAGEVGIAVTRYCRGEVTSVYDLRSVEEKWAS
jgi:hypothetical protein